MKRNKRKNKSIIFRVFLLLVCAYFTFTLAGLWNSLDIKIKELNSLEKDRQALINEVEELKTLLSSDSNAEIIEKAARERLGYIYSDEQVFVDISGN